MASGRELLAQTVRDTDPRRRDYAIVRDVHAAHDDLVMVEWLTGSWAGQVTAWTVDELEPLGFGARPPARPRCYCPDDCGCGIPWRRNVCGCRAHVEV